MNRNTRLQGPNQGVIYWTQTVHNGFIFLCSLHYHLSATLQITVVNLQDNQTVFRIFIALLRFSFDSPSYNFTTDTQISSEGPEAYSPLKELCKQNKKTTSFDKLLDLPQYTPRGFPQCKTFKMTEVLPYNDTHLNMFCRGMMLRNEAGGGGHFVFG